MFRGLEFGQAVEFWSKFPIASLARINLSFVPLWDMLSHNDVGYTDVASVGPGSCTHEVALALLSEHANVHCFDATDSYIPDRTRPYFDDLPRLHFEIYDLSRDLEQDFDLVLAIQTLQHIADAEAALDVLVRAVRPGGHLYIDTPVFHERPEREPDYERHKERVWANNQYHHIGFSRRLMAERIASRGLELVDSGYYSYLAGDHSVMRYARESQIESAAQATPATVRALNRSLSVSLVGCERAYADRRDMIDELPHADRVCHAIRLLARRPEDPSPRKTARRLRQV